MNTTELVIEIRPEKNSGLVSQRSWVQNPYGLNFFSGLISTTSSVVFTTARIDSLLVFCRCFSKRIPSPNICSSNASLHRFSYWHSHKYTHFINFHFHWLVSVSTNNKDINDSWHFIGSPPTIVNLARAIFLRLVSQPIERKGKSRLKKKPQNNTFSS